MRDYLVAANAPAILIRLQNCIYPPGSWSVLEDAQTVSSEIKEEWTWRRGFLNWAALALSELLRDNSEHIAFPRTLLLKDVL